MKVDAAQPLQTAAAMRQLAIALFAFLLAATLPYIWLIENFGYDDILREPAAVVLQRFHEGGSPLVLAWFGFAMSALLFIIAADSLLRLVIKTRPAGAQP